MKKRIKFFVSILMIFALFVSCFCIPAASFENDIVTSTADMLLINTDTETVVFSQKPDNKWYAGYLTELMTYLLAEEKIDSPETVTFKVEQSFIDGLPYSDGSLKKFVGQTLTAQDLEVIMLLTTGSDAAYALADIASDGDIDAFVKDMNAKAAQLGMKKTGYVCPGFSDSETEYNFTTCRDLYALYRNVCVLKSYQKIMALQSYTPKGLDKKKYTVKVEMSMLNEKSPYYFRYTNGGKYSYTKETYAGVVMTTTYHGMTYFFAGLLGKDESEENVYADARMLLTWAYLNLSDEKIISADSMMSGVTVNTDWGQYDVGLYLKESSYKTLPNEYDDKKLTTSYNVPESVNAPLFAGQTVGTVKIAYDGEQIDDLNLIVSEDEGVGMLHDCGRFGRHAYAELMAFSDLSPSFATQEESETTAPEKDKKNAGDQTEKTADTAAAEE